MVVYIYSMDKWQKRKRGRGRMNYDKKCKWHKSCGYDFCHGEGVCPEFEKGKPPKETEKESGEFVGDA